MDTTSAMRRSRERELARVAHTCRCFFGTCAATGVERGRVRAGGIALLVIFAAAAVFHQFHGQIMDAGQLEIYAASGLAVMTNSRR